MATAVEEIKKLQRSTEDRERDYFTIPEFEIVADLFPDHRLELINGEIVMSPPPDKRHQKHTLKLTRLFARHSEDIEKLECDIGAGGHYFEVPEEIGRQFMNKSGGYPSDVCPDASICYQDYLDIDRCPPALLVIEILSDSKREHVFRDMATKPEIYSALEIPTYWIVDRRSESVWVHTGPNEGGYASRQQLKGNVILPAPGLEFLQITPAQIFAD